MTTQESRQQRPTPPDFSLNLHVNGAVHAVEAPANATLLDVLRERLHLTGSKKGCDHGQCGPARCTWRTNRTCLA